MAVTFNKLTDAYIRSVSKSGRHSDGGGLYLNVSKTDAKSWVFMWKRNGKRREMGLGSATGAGNVAKVSLALARKKAQSVRTTLAEGGDPLSSSNRLGVPSFGDAADEFLKSMESQWRNEKHRAQWRMTLTHYAGPLRTKSVDAIDTTDVLAILQPIWKTKSETASRLRGRIERVIDYATARGFRAGDNPARWKGHLANILPARQKLTRGHHAAMPYADVPEFFSVLEEMSSTSARALEFLILTASRTGEVIGAEWCEFDLKNAVWTIPARRMKATREHRVPLPSRSLELLNEMHSISDKFVFPGHKAHKPLSNMAMSNLLKKHAANCTVHGFRSAFRDWVEEETNFSRDLAEAALAHVVGDATERAYRRGDVLEKRRGLLAAWERFLTSRSATVYDMKGVQVGD